MPPACVRNTQAGALALHFRICMRRLLLFAPGAGAPSSHPWIQNWKERLSEIGDIETFDYDYMREGRRRPDPLPRLIAAHRKALNRAREAHRHGSTILIGKSMGGRVGCHLSLDEQVDGLVCLGYPLCAMGDRTRLRDEVLRALTTPILFVQGTRDSLCPLALFGGVRAEMKAPNFLHVVEGGDHSLRVPKRQLQASGETQEHVDRRILKAITNFVARFNLF
jgi:predicted alpha/beta-hydrolase family hydrolase